MWTAWPKELCPACAYVTLYGVQFEGEGDTFEGESVKVLRNIAEVLKAYPTGACAWKCTRTTWARASPTAAAAKCAAMPWSIGSVQEGGVEKTARLSTVGGVQTSWSRTTERGGPGTQPAH